MSIWNKTFTLQQLVQEAEKKQKMHVNQLARHLCLREQLNPEGKEAACFISQEFCTSNREAVARWVRAYLAGIDVLPTEADINELEREFRLLLLDRLPPHMFGGYE
jgi:hypothetical protein